MRKDLKEELKRIDDFFENISIPEFENMLVRNGIEDYEKYDRESEENDR